jgi:hypothetical protein
MRNHPLSHGTLDILITTVNETSISILSSASLNTNIKTAVDVNMSFTSDSNFTLPFDLTCEYNTIEPKGVIIQTSKQSTVTIFDSFKSGSNDGTLIIPTDKLSTQYLVSSTKPHDTSHGSYYSQFAIGSLSDRTDIKITFRMDTYSRITLHGIAYGDGDVYSLTLDRLETFQINHTADLTGTFITSTKPVAVFSGDRCNKLLSEYCSHMVTQLPPTAELDHLYIVPPFFHNIKTLTQIVTPTDNTVNATVEGRESTVILNEGGHRNIQSKQTVVIDSLGPVLVTGFGMGNSTSPYIDPYMTVIPGVHQYLDYYKISVPSGYTENFLCIIYPAASSDNIQINGFSFGHYSTVYQSSVHLDKAYSFRFLQVKNDYETYVLSSTDGSNFGLIVYGHRRVDGYGFSGNFVLP